MRGAAATAVEGMAMAAAAAETKKRVIETSSIARRVFKLVKQEIRGEGRGGERQ